MYRQACFPNWCVAFSTAAAALLAAAGVQAQQIIPVEQTRTLGTGGFIEACGFDQNLDDALAAADFDPFNEQLLQSVTCDQAHGVAIAHQNSRIGPQSLTAVGGAHVETNAEVLNTMLVGAGSNFDVTFELSEESEFTLVGRIGGLAVGDDTVFWSAAVGLFADPGPDSRVIVRHDVGANATQGGRRIEISESGVLPAGIYRLSALASPIIDAPFNPAARASASYSITFTLGADAPCPADLDGDGGIGLSDLAILLGNFGTPAGANPEDGDLDGDGDVDLSDLAVMLALFGTACP